MADETNAKRPDARRDSRTARVATGADAESMGAMFARAFAEDPVWAWMCGARYAHFTRRAAPFFAVETRRHLRLGSAWTVPGANAGALWAPPGAWKTSLVDLARWAPSATRVFGSHLARSLQALAKVDQVHPSEDHWYLALLGTDPDHQRTGLGSALLAPVLAECDTEGLPAYLETSKEENLAFYARHGFVETSRMMLGGPAGVPMWTMWRDPQVPGTP